MAAKRPGDTPPGDMAAKRPRTAARREDMIAGKPTPTTVSARLRRSETKHDTYVVAAGDIDVVTTLTARPAVARRWVHTTRWRHGRRLRSGAGITVGMGVQWTPPFRALGDGAEPRPGTLELCVANRCLVYQIAQAAAAAVPAVLRRFLADDGVVTVGYNIRSDCRKLEAHHGLEVACPRELRDVTGMGGASMETMAEKLLGRHGRMKKPASVGRSKWEAPKLSKKQVKYACVDAVLSFRLGVHVGVTPASTSAY